MKRVVFWISAGEKFIEEARRCSKELREVMPGMVHILFTPEETTDDGFDRLAKLPERTAEYWYLDSVRYFNMAFDMLVDYDECLYFDSDINFLSPFPELWRMLERFDIAAPMGSRRVTGDTFQELPPCFPEYELGLILFRRNAVVKELFVEWERLHWAHPNIYGSNDQRSFREAVWNIPEVKIERIPSEYHLRWPFGVFMSLEVKILHGRPLGEWDPDAPTIDDVKGIVNSHLDMRVWSARSPRWRDGVIPAADYLERR
jgi:hypothetical protein